MGGDRCDQEVVLARHPPDEGGEGGEHGHERRGPQRGGERPNGGCQLEGEVDPQGRAGPGAGAVSADRQLDGERGAGQLLAPPGPLAPRRGRRAGRRRRSSWVGRPAATAAPSNRGRVQGRELPAVDVDGPVVEGRVVQPHDHDVVVGAQPDDVGLEERPGGEVERPARRIGQQAGHAVVALVRRQVAEVLVAHREPVADDLLREAVGQVEGRPERLVPAGQLVERPLEGGNVEGTSVPAHEARQVEAPGRELLVPEHRLLRHGDGNSRPCRRSAVAEHDEDRGSGRPPPGRPARPDSAPTLSRSRVTRETSCRPAAPDALTAAASAGVRPTAVARRSSISAQSRSGSNVPEDRRRRLDDRSAASAARAARLATRAPTRGRASRPSPGRPRRPATVQGRGGASGAGGYPMSAAPVPAAATARRAPTLLEGRELRTGRPTGRHPSGRAPGRGPGARPPTRAARRPPRPCGRRGRRRRSRSSAGARTGGRPARPAVTPPATSPRATASDRASHASSVRSPPPSTLIATRPRHRPGSLRPRSAPGEGEEAVDRVREGQRDVARAAEELGGAAVDVPGPGRPAERRPSRRRRRRRSCRGRGCHRSGRGRPVPWFWTYQPPTDGPEDGDVVVAVTVVVGGHGHVAAQAEEDRVSGPATYQPPTEGRKTAMSSSPSPS